MCESRNAHAGCLEERPKWAHTESVSMYTESVSMHTESVSMSQHAFTGLWDWCQRA